MINKIVYKLHEALCQSRYARCLISVIYRIWFSRERSVVTKFIQNNTKTVIAINAYQIYEFSHIQPLYERIAEDPSWTVILIGSNPKKIQLPEYQTFMRENHLILNENVFSYIWLPVLQPDLFLSTAITQYHQLCPDKTINVLFAHGLSSLGFSKNQAHIKNAVAYDYIMSTGPYQIKALEIAANQYKVTLPEIIRGGFIRGDMLAEKAQSFSSHVFRERCKLSDKYTILFAPTWGEFSATAEWIDPIADLCDELDFNLLIKLHPLMLKGQTKWESAGIDWPAKLNQLNEKENIHICNQFDLEEYMLGSNIMITDVSSVGIEYMFLGKPVIFLPSPQFFDFFGRDKPIFWVRDGLEVQDRVELKEKLKKLHDGSKFVPDYDIVGISFNQGNAIERISSAIGNLCKRKDDRWMDDK